MQELDSSTRETMNLEALQEAARLLGKRRNWEGFFWLPSSRIVDGKQGWNLFIETLDEQDLRHVLSVAKQQGV